MKLNILTHSGGNDILEVNSYDPIALNEQINNDRILTIVIGNNIYSRIDIKNIKLIEEVASEEPIEEINQ